MVVYIEVSGKVSGVEVRDGDLSKGQMEELELWKFNSAPRNYDQEDVGCLAPYIPNHRSVITEANVEAVRCLLNDLIIERGGVIDEKEAVVVEAPKVEKEEKVEIGHKLKRRVIRAIGRHKK